MCEAETSVIRQKLLKILFVSIVWSLVTPLHDFAQSGPHSDVRLIEEVDLSKFIVRHWTTRDGLPGNHINQLLHSKDGNIWIGTGTGLVRFDGLDFEVYTTESTNALSSGYITALAEDSAGQLWIFLANSGLVSRANEEFKRWIGRSRVPVGLEFATADEAGNVWLYADDRFWTISDGEYRAWSGLESPPPNTVLSDVFTDVLFPAYFVSGENDLFRFDGRAARKVSCTELESLHLGSIVYPTSKLLWKSLDGEHVAQLYNGKFVEAQLSQDLEAENIRLVFSDDADRTWTIGLDRTLRSAFDHSDISIEETNGLFPVKKNAGVWVGSQTGDAFLIKGGTLKRFQLGGVSDARVITAIEEDAEETIWIGTDRGLFQLIPKKVETISVDEGLPTRFTRPIRQMADESVWVGTWGGGIARFQGRDVSHFTTEDGLLSDYIWTIFQSKDNSIWIGSNNGGVNRYDVENERFERIHRGVVRAITEDRHGRIWFSDTGLTEGHANGLFTWSGGAAKRFLLRENADIGRIWTMHFDSEGTLWVGSERGLYQIADERHRHYTVDDGMSDNWVVSLFEDSEGNLWAGTQSAGLNRLKDGAFSRVNMANGLFANSVWSARADGLGFVWMSSNNGIFRVEESELIDVADGDADRLSVISFTEADGMPSAECNLANPASWMDTDGFLWFPTVSGAVKIDPGAAVHNSREPPVQIWHSVVDGAPVPRHELQSLPPGNKNLEFRFSILSLTAPEKNKYRYLLEGFDDSWREGVGGSIARYTNVPPGRYTFRVVGANDAGIWNLRGDEVSLSFRPPFLQSTWFYLLLFSLIAGCSLFAFRYRLRIHRQLAVERTKIRIARDLHDDIGSRFGTIALGLELIQREETLDRSTSGRLSRNLDRVRQLSSYFKDSLWIVHSEEEDLKDLIERIRAAAEEILQARSYHFSAPIELHYQTIDMEVRRHIYLIVKEAIYNASKYGDKSPIGISITYENPRLLLMIRNGRTAVSGETLGEGRGIKNMTWRAKEIGGILNIDQSEDGSTVVSLEVDIL